MSTPTWLSLSKDVGLTPNSSKPPSVSTVRNADSEKLSRSSSKITPDPTEYSKTEVFSPEGAQSWEHYTEDELPEKRQGKWIRSVRFQVFSMYRRIFGVVFAVNMAILVETVVRGVHGLDNIDALHLSLITLSNLFVAIVMRQDNVVNAWFRVFCLVPSSWPMWIRRITARVYAIGGIHSGCGISGLFWLILFTVQATREVVNSGKTSIATLVVTYCILALLLVIVAFAHPALRAKFHNNFEQSHRFLGWTAVGLVWAQVVLLTNDYRSPEQPLKRALVHAPQFWMICIMTGSIASSWLLLRKVPVRAEVLSSHALRVYFDDQLHPTPGSFRRITDSPLKEWHSFATIAEPGRTGYSLIISKAGDWTTRHINNPPKEIWVRGEPTLGVLRVVPMFRRIVLVATGSGIGPCAPHIFAKTIPIKVLWTAPNVRATFGDKLVDSVLDSAPDALIYDTRTRGKPDMVKLTYHLYREFNAEAVVIISNPRLTEKVVYGMMSRGVPAFGAIWDS